MRVLKEGMAMPGVARWQQFLKGQKIDPGDIDGVFDPQVTEATRKFQEKHELNATGVVGFRTLSKAEEFGYEPEEQFDIGPDQIEDLRTCRPYFLIPLPEPPPDPDQQPASDLKIKDTTLDQSEERREARWRIRRWIQKTEDPTDPQPITDIYIFSHGWHRNFYSSVSAYDRLISRLARLLRGGRLDEETSGFKPSKGQKFRPLFLNLHWHSDPGEDDFVDKAGRRDKTSFLQKVSEAFEPSESEHGIGVNGETLLKDFEDIFALFSRLAAPDIRTLHKSFDIEARQLTQSLDQYQLKNVSEQGLNFEQVRARRPGKVAVAWSCYHEAQIQAVHVDQDAPPKPYIGAWQAWSTLGKFVVAVVGITALVGGLLGFVNKIVHHALLNIGDNLACQLCVFLLPFLFYGIVTLVSYQSARGAPQSSQDSTWVLTKPPALSGRIHDALLAVCNGTVGLALFVFLIRCLVLVPGPLHSWAAINRWYENPARFETAFHSLYMRFWDTWLIACGLCLIAWCCWGYLWIAGHIRATAPRPGGSKSIIALPILFWLPLEVVVFLPTALWLLFTYLTGWMIAFFSIKPPSLFDERTGQRNKRTGKTAWPELRDRLAIAARFPIHLVRRAMPPDNGAHAWLDTVDGLLAFYEMQKSGVATGVEAAKFMNQLIQETPELQHPDLRVHLVGHSFGGLVVANMVRQMALDKKETEQKPLTAGNPPILLSRVDSLCLLEGAMASSWFEEEETLRRFVHGSIACIYSLYDTANGFYYPLANNGRMAAGYVGLTHVGGDPSDKKSAKPSTLPECRSQFVLLVRPPNLDSDAYRHCPGSLKPGSPRILNLDGSRIICEGPVGAGGGHDDIFKDDVVNLLWAVSRLNTPAHAVVAAAAPVLPQGSRV